MIFNSKLNFLKFYSLDYGKSDDIQAIKNRDKGKIFGVSMYFFKRYFSVKKIAFKKHLVSKKNKGDFRLEMENKKLLSKKETVQAPQKSIVTPSILKNKKIKRFSKIKKEKEFKTIEEMKNWAKLLLEKRIGELSKLKDKKKEPKFSRKFKRTQFYYKYVKKRIRWWDAVNFIKRSDGWYHLKRMEAPVPTYRMENRIIKKQIAKSLAFPINIARKKKFKFFKSLYGCMDIVMKKMFRRYGLYKLIRRKCKRVYRRKRFPTLAFHKTDNNLFYVLSDQYGRTFHISSIGTFGLKGKRRFDRPGMKRVALDIAARFKFFHLYRVDVICRSSIRKGIQNLLWGFKNTGLQILRLVDLIRMPHGNVRLPARRRMKRRKR
jgi:ribosomal protein S11